MPYIPEEKRRDLNVAINDLIVALDNPDDEDTRNKDGLLNYCICQLLMESLEMDDSPRYTQLNTMIGILECVKMEIYRRVGIPYEDAAIKKPNAGDIESFETFERTLRNK